MYSAYRSVLCLLAASSLCMGACGCLDQRRADPPQHEPEPWPLAEPDAAQPEATEPQLPEFSSDVIVHRTPESAHTEIAGGIASSPYQLALMRVGGDDAEFEEFFTRTKRLDDPPLFHLVDPVPGVGEAHAFECRRFERYWVAENVAYSCGGTDIHYGWSDGKFADETLQAWWDALYAHPPRSVVAHFEFSLHMPTESASTSRAILVYENDAGTKHIRLYVPREE